MIPDPFQGLKSALHGTALGQWGWLERQVFTALDMLSSPLTGIKTRYHWVQLVEALLLALLVFWTARGALGVGISGFLRYAFPRQLYTHPSSIVDYKLNVVNYFTGSAFTVTWRLNTPLMTGGVVAALVWAFGPAHSGAAPEWGLAALLGFTALLWLAEDLGYYIFHYASHKIPFIWAFHKVHHSAELLTPFTAGRVHPMEYAFVAPLRAATTALVLGPAIYLYGSEPTLATWYGMSLFVVVSGALGEQLLHSHVWLSYGPFWERFILSPAQHQIHHSSEPRHWDRNFAGRFALWDWLFGTVYIPKGKEEFRYGIYGVPEQLHPGLTSAYVRPYWDMLPFKRQILDAAGLFLGPWAVALAQRWRLEPKPRGPAPAWRGQAVLLAGLAALLAGTAALHAFWMLPNHDNDWWMILTARFLDGGRYLRDIMETNPPMMALLLAPAVVLERTAGIDRAIAFALWITALIALALALIWPVLRGLVEGRAFAAGAVLGAIGAAFCLLPGYDFGQREHVFAILFLPGLFWLAAREAGRAARFWPHGAVCVALAALGMLIKPFFLVVLAPLFLGRAWRLGLAAALRDPAAWTIVGITAGFGLLIFAAFPEYLDVAALHTQVYFAFERAWLHVLSETTGMFSALVLAVALVELVGLDAPRRAFLRQIGAAAGMCLLIGIAQKRGLLYHFLPVLLLALTMLAVLAGVALRARPAPSLAPPMALALAALLLGQTLVLALRPIDEWRTFSRPYHAQSPVIQALREQARGRSLLVIDSGFRAGVPWLVEARLVGRAPSQLLLPGTVKLLEGEGARRARGEAMRAVATAQLVEDLARHRPDVVAVHVALDRQALADDFDMLGFYAADAEFRREWAAYDKVSEARGWEIYRRRP